MPPSVAVAVSALVDGAAGLVMVLFVRMFVPGVRPGERVQVWIRASAGSRGVFRSVLVNGVEGLACRLDVLRAADWAGPQSLLEG